MTSTIGGLVNSTWVAGRSIVACGVRVGVRTNKPELLDRALAALPDIWRPSRSPVVERIFSMGSGTSAGLRRNGGSWHRLYENNHMITHSKDVDWVVDCFERQLKMYLAEMARSRVFVHAGAVGWRGKAIIVPGRSFSGKTTLVTELVRAGATYYSDEYAVLDKYGRVHSYSAPLEIRNPITLMQKKYKVEEFGGKVGANPLPVGLIVVSKYKPGHRWSPRRLSIGQSILELFNHTVPARRNPEAVLRTLQQPAAEAVTLKGPRGDAKETARLILDYLH